MPDKMDVTKHICSAANTCLKRNCVASIPQYIGDTTRQDVFDFFRDPTPCHHNQHSDGQFHKVTIIESK